MPWQHRIRRMIGSAVGVSLRDGTGTSGTLCGVRGREIYVMEYMYQDQFAMKQYSFDMIQDVTQFPPCRMRPEPRQPLY